MGNEQAFGKQLSYFEKLGLSKCISHPAYSPWRVISDADVRSFSKVTRDPNFIHLDLKATREKTRFDKTIAQGFYILSLLVDLTLSALPGFPGEQLWINYGINKLRFTEAVLIGSKVRAKIELVDVVETEVGIRISFAVEVQIEGQAKPALVAEWVNLLI